MLPMLTNSSLLRHQQTLMPPSPAVAPQGGKREFTFRGRPAVAGYRVYAARLMECEEPRIDILDTICHVKPADQQRNSLRADVADVVSVFSRSIRSSPEALNGD